MTARAPGAALLAGGAALAALCLLASPGAIVAALGAGTAGVPDPRALAGARLCRLGLAAHGALLLAAGAWRLRSAARAARMGRALAAAVAPAPHAPLWRPLASGTPPAGAPGAVLLGALLAAALALRLIHLGGGLWMDEVFTLVDYVRLPAGRILLSFSRDNQHMLYSLAARASVTLLGENPIALRLPAVLFGVASLWALFRLAALAVGRREALLATALLAASYHHVWFSQNARGYTGLLLGTLLSTDLLLRALWGDRWRFWIGYAAVVALTAWIHLTMVFVPAAHLLVVAALLARRRAPRAAWGRALGAFLLAGTLTAQLYALVAPHMAEFFLRPGAGSTTAAVEWKNPLWLVNETLRGLGVGLALGWSGLAAGAALGAAGAIAFVRRDATLAALALGPALLGGAAMLALGRNLWPRFFFNEAGFAALIVVCGAASLGSFAARVLRVRATPLGTALALFLVAASALSLPRGYRLPKQDYVGARDFVRARVEPGDAVVALDVAGIVYSRYYAPEWIRADTVEELAAARAVGGRTWVLYTLPRYLAAAKPELFRTVESEYETLRTFPGTLGDGAVIVRRSR